MSTFMPIIKMNDPKLRYIFRGLPITSIIIRLQDLFTPRNFDFNNVFRDIQSAGGIHKYLNFNGTIILSLVMKDQIIAETAVHKYIEAIQTIKPDYCTTVDGETYEGEYFKSMKEIMRSYGETRQIMNACPNVKFIGLVKGCHKMMISMHILMLKQLNIEKFMFHTGDFARRGNQYNKGKAKDYAVLIRKKVDTLYLYGTGSQKKILEYSFADAYISFNYFVVARNGQQYQGVNSINYVGRYSPAIARKNLIAMLRNMQNTQFQQKLLYGGICPWEEVREVEELIIRVPDQAILEAT